MKINPEEIEQAITSGRAIPVTGSHSSAKSYVVDTSGGRVFYKKYFNRNPATGGTTVEWIRGPAYLEMVYSMPAPMYIANVPLEIHVAKEVRTMQRWHEAGLPVPRVLHFDDDKTIVFEYMRGHSLERDLAGELNEVVFSKMLDSFNEVRRRAKEMGDKDFLHSDPYADNFFYDEERKIVVPYDPAKAVRTDIDFDEADARMNLLFLSKLFLLETDWENKVAYVNQTVDRFTREESGLAAELNADPARQREYFARYPLPKKNIIDIYFREEIREVVQRVLAG